MSAVELKERARQIIECLAKLDQSKRPGGGVHGQVIGMEPYVIRTNGDGLQCLYEAQSLLDELLDPFDRRPAPQGALTDAAIIGMAAESGLFGTIPQMLHFARAIEARNQQGDAARLDELEALAESAYVGMCFEIDGGVHMTIEAPSSEPVAYRNQNNIRDALDAAIEQRKADKKGNV